MFQRYPVVTAVATETPHDSFGQTKRSYHIIQYAERGHRSVTAKKTQQTSAHIKNKKRSSSSTTAVLRMRTAVLRFFSPRLPVDFRQVEARQDQRYPRVTCSETGTPSPQTKKKRGVFLLKLRSIVIKVRNRYYWPPTTQRNTPRNYIAPNAK